MAYTSVLNEETNIGDIDGVNAFQLFLITFISGIVITFYGINESNNLLGVAGLLFSILSLSGVILIEKVGGSFFVNGATLEESAFAFWAPAILLAIGSQFRTIDITFSAVAPPGKAYAASALAGEPEAVKTFFEVILSAQGENIAFFGIGVVIIKFMIERYGTNIYSVGAGLVPLGAVFAVIHTTELSFANLNFIVSAFALMFIMGLYLYGTDLDLQLPLSEAAIYTLSFFGGVHFGLNSSNTHGLIGVFFADPYGILNIPDPTLQVLSYFVTIVYGLSFGFALKYVYMYMKG
jgi:hypothetical protein